MSPLRISIVCSAHPPGDTRIFARWVRGLHAAGMAVSLIAPEIPPLPEMPPGVPLRAVAPHRGYVSRLRHAARVLGPLRQLDPDIAIYPDPELHQVMLDYRHQSRCAVVFDRHENFDQPETLYQGAGPVARAIARLYPLYERRVCPKLDGVIVVIPGMLERIPKDCNAVVAHNYPTLAVLDALARPPAPGTPSYTAINLGAVQASRGYQHYLDLARVLVRDRRRGDFTMCLGGQWDPGALDSATHYLRRHGLEANVTLVPRRIPHAEAIALTSAARIGFTPYIDNPKARDQLQNKLLEFMGAGLPVITSPTSLNRQIVEAAGCGVLHWADELQPLADTIERWMDHPDEVAELGRRGQQYVRDHLVWESELARVLPWLEHLVMQRARP